VSAVRTVLAGVAASLFAAGAFAGTYYNTANCSVALGCNAGVPDADLSQIINKDGIVYPPSFVAPPGTSANVRVCVVSAFGTGLDEAAAWAADKWNQLIPKTENCFHCTSNEDGEMFTSKYNLASTVLHELGHCAMALDHTTLIISEAVPPTPVPPRHPTSWTVSYDGSRLLTNSGTDLVRGSKDDTQGPVPGNSTKNVFWFRIADNDPVKIDATPIDISTFSYDPTLLAGAAGTWPANANRAVTTSGPPGGGAPAIAGVRETVAIMNDGLNMTQVFFDLTADEVNMVKMSRTGINRAIGGGDDNSIGITLVSCAGAYDVKVVVGTPIIPGVLAECDARTGYVFPAAPHPPAQDYKLVGPYDLVVNAAFASSFDFRIPVFWNGFEIGSTDNWSSAVP
jgi:hypothetical protein